MPNLEPSLESGTPVYEWHKQFAGLESISVYIRGLGCDYHKQHDQDILESRDVYSGVVMCSLVALSFFEK